GSEDPDTTPFLEIADQKGNPLKIPHKERKALILAMGFHEKGRSLMKRKQYDNALCHLLQADQQFSKCDSALLTSVDNYAVLQLDIVWCYRALEALSCLDDGKSRLRRAEDCFLQCYGEQRERLRMIKVNCSHVYNSNLAAANHISSRRQEQEELKQRERQKRRRRMEDISSLTEMGFSRRDAARALHRADGDVDKACEVRGGFITSLSEKRSQLKIQFKTDTPSSDPPGLQSTRSAEQQQHRGGRESREGGAGTPPDTALHHLTSTVLIGSSMCLLSSEDEELVSEVLDDISHHEEDYLDLTLEEESELIDTMKTYLSRGPTHTV
ncbi:NEDD8 ultimate buster 1-like, partial [Seriola lalandi dorsalis]|uniref:NEDD8 ultimate buster 1-like n=1 Tax=Seriola lalandi dorsalis TaxID=1841481 RepID=UPI000C6F75CB